MPIAPSRFQTLRENTILDNTTTNTKQIQYRGQTVPMLLPLFRPCKNTQYSAIQQHIQRKSNIGTNKRGEGQNHFKNNFPLSIKKQRFFKIALLKGLKGMRSLKFVQMLCFRKNCTNYSKNDNSQRVAALSLKVKMSHFS